MRWARALVIAGAIMLPATAQTRSAEYRKSKLFYPGYTDRQMAPGRWLVTGTSMAGAAGQALPIALYRSALVLKRAGYSHMQVVRSALEIHQYGMGANQYAKLQVVGLHSSDAPQPCENKKRNLHLCERVPVEGVIATMGAELGHSKAEIAEDYAALSS